MLEKEKIHKLLNLQWCKAEKDKLKLVNARYFSGLKQLDKLTDINFDNDNDFNGHLSN